VKETEAVLCFENVTKRFGQRVAVDAVDFSLVGGRTLGLVGESGSGKTTCIRLALGLERATSGTVRFRGTRLGHSRRSLRPVRRQLGFVFQDPYDSLDPRMTLERIVGEPLKIHGVPRSARHERVRSALSDVGLPDAPLDSYPARFSGGGRQRIAIARALVMQPSALLCDEPTASLDVSVQAQIVNLLLSLKQARGLSMIFVSHDLGLVRRIADDIVVMYGGRVVEAASATAIYERPQHHYTAALLAAVPGEHPRRRRITSVRTAAESPAGAPVAEADGEKPAADVTGCVFAARCPRAESVCRTKRPPLVAAPDGRMVACFFPLGQMRDSAVGAVAGPGATAGAVPGAEDSPPIPVSPASVRVPDEPGGPGGSSVPSGADVSLD
jgi:peptide/nickel transport system ATP-binding protein